MTDSSVDPRSGIFALEELYHLERYGIPQPDIEIPRSAENLADLPDDDELVDKLMHMAGAAD